MKSMRISNSSIEIEEMMASVRSRMGRTNCEVEQEALGKKLAMLNGILPDVVREERKWIKKSSDVMYP